MEASRNKPDFSSGTEGKISSMRETFRRRLCLSIGQKTMQPLVRAAGL